MRAWFVLTAGNTLFFRSPQPAQAVSRQFGPVARKNTFVVHSIGANHTLICLEITQIPDMLTNPEGFAAQHFDVTKYRLRLIFFSDPDHPPGRSGNPKTRRGLHIGGTHWSPGRACCFSWIWNNIIRLLEIKHPEGNLQGV